MLAVLLQAWLLLTLGLLAVLALVVVAQWVLRKVRAMERPLTRTGYDARARAGT